MKYKLTKAEPTAQDVKLFVAEQAYEGRAGNRHQF